MPEICLLCNFFKYGRANCVQSRNLLLVLLFPLQVCVKIVRLLFPEQGVVIRYFADYPARVATRNHAVGNIVRNNGVGTYHHVVADCNAGVYHGVTANPHVVSYRNAVPVF